MIQVTLSPDRSKLALRFPYNPGLVERVKQLPGRVWSKRLNAWLLPLTSESFSDLKSYFADCASLLEIDDRVTQFLAEKAHAAKQVVDWKSSFSNTSGDVNLPAGVTFHTTPYHHQKIALKLCIERHNFALFMEMGTGKSKVMVDLLGYGLKKVPSLRCLVICPVAVMENWALECWKHQPGLLPQVLMGTKDRKLELLRDGLNGGKHVYVVNYESAWRIEKELAGPKWDVMILDESTKIKNRATNQAKAILRLSQRAGRKYILTGTPMPNNPLELFNQVKFLDPTVFGTNWYVFRDRYAIMGGYGNYQLIGWKNMDELAQKLNGISYRVLKKDCLDLPEKSYKTYKLEMDADQKKAYDEMADDLVTEVQGTSITASVVLAKLTKLRQITSGFIYTEQHQTIWFKGNPKLEQLKELLPAILGQHKVVIWGTFKEELNLIEQLCVKELGIVPQNIVRYDGDTPMAERQGLIDRFQSSDACRVFLGQQRAGGLGITLTAADYCVFYSNDYASDIRLQAEDRLHRIGQKNPVTYIDLLMKGTLDVTIKAALKKKEELAGMITAMNIEELIRGQVDF